jgi:hypothetical protein
MKTSLKLILAPLALGVAGQAHADHVAVVGPTSYSTISAGTGDSTASADIRNGVSAPGSNYIQGLGSTETQLITPSGSTASATVATASGSVPGRTSGGFAYSSLDTGILKSQLIQTPPTAYGYPGADSEAQIADTVFFTNTSGHAINLGLTFSFDGTAGVFEPNSVWGLGYLTMLSCSSCRNSAGEGINFLGTNTLANIAIYSEFNETGVYNVYDQYGGQHLNPLDFYELDNANGISSFITTTLVIPVGETSLGLDARLYLHARSAGSADFSHTASLGFGALEQGLSFSSASGVFLQGLGQTAPVPEPTTWLMALAGFFMIGRLMRRRAVVNATAVA